MENWIFSIYETGVNKWKPLIIDGGKDFWAEFERTDFELPSAFT